MRTDKKIYFEEWKEVCLEGREGDDNECSVLLLALIQKYVESSSRIEINAQFIKDFEGLFEVIVQYLLSQYNWVIVTSDVENTSEEVYEKVEPVKKFISSLNSQVLDAKTQPSDTEGSESKNSTTPQNLPKLSASLGSPIHTLGTNSLNENQTQTLSPK